MMAPGAAKAPTPAKPQTESSDVTPDAGSTARLRVLVVCDSPPVSSGPGFDGNTLISAEVLPRLAGLGQFDLTIAWFEAAGIQPDAAVLEAAVDTAILPLRTGGPVFSPGRFTLPNVVRERNAPQARAAVARLSAAHDATLLFGLGSLGLARDVKSPLVINEVDPLSLTWFDQVRDAKGARRAALAARGVRIRLVEWLASRSADEYLLINSADAAELGRLLKRPIASIPNGVRPGPATAGTATPGQLIFVGTLDYPANVHSATVLVKQVLPAARQSDPDAHVVLVGRRPSPEVLALAGPHVTIEADVPDVMAMFAGASLAVFPGGFGRGTRNSVLEALRAGCPVVSSPVSARGIAATAGLLSVDDAKLPKAVADLLTAPQKLAEMRSAAWVTGQALPDWQQIACDYGDLLRETARRFARH